MRFVLASMAIFSLGWLGCLNKQHPGEPAAPPGQIILTAEADPLRLREQPGVEARVLASLPKGTPLADHGEVSPFLTSIRLRGRQFQAPWLLVATADGTRGWVYAGEVNPAVNSGVDSLHFHQEKILLALLGTEIYQRLAQFRSSFSQIGSARELAGIYRQGCLLRDRINRRLTEKIRQTLSAGGNIPDLFWLGEYFPGFTPALVEGGTTYYFFIDFRPWLVQARQTTGSREDDRFFDLMVQCFPEDSVEFFFPAWQIQTGDQEGHSLLGRGVHLDILRMIDRIFKEDPLFSAELVGLKNRLLNDVTGPATTYWESREAVFAEMDTLLRLPLEVLSASDRVALQSRRQQMILPESDIRFNLQSGQ